MKTGVIIAIVAAVVAAIVALLFIAPRIASSKKDKDKGPEMVYLSSGDVVADGDYLVGCGCGKETTQGYDKDSKRTVITLAGGADFAVGNKKYRCHC